MKPRHFALVGMIVSLLAGILNGQAPVEIHAASSSAVSGWTQMMAPSGSAIWVAPETRSPASAPRSPSRPEPGPLPGCGCGSRAAAETGPPTPV